MNKKFPLVIEPFPENYTGYKFITLIRYNDQNTLNIVDNVINNMVITYTLDLCGPENVNEELIIDTAYNWFENSKDLYPISIEFSKNGLAAETSKIVRCFPIDYISRVIGPLPEYKMAGVYKIRKRKKREISKSIQIVRKFALENSEI